MSTDEDKQRRDAVAALDQLPAVWRLDWQPGMLERRHRVITARHARVDTGALFPLYVQVWATRPLPPEAHEQMQKFVAECHRRSYTDHVQFSAEVNVGAVTLVQDHDESLSTLLRRVKARLQMLYGAMGLLMTTLEER